MTPSQFSCDNEPLAFIGLHVQENEKYYKLIELVPRVSCSPVTTYLVHAFLFRSFIVVIFLLCHCHLCNGIAGNLLTYALAI